MKHKKLAELVGAGVGIGVLGQEENNDEPEEDDNDADDSETSDADKENSSPPDSESSPVKKEQFVMKIKKTDLQEMVKRAVTKKLHELADRDSVPGKDGELGKYAEKLDKFVSDSIDEVNDLIKEAEEMMKENLLNHPTIGERNRALMSRVGVLKNLKAKLLEILEATHRSI